MSTRASRSAPAGDSPLASSRPANGGGPERGHKQGRGGEVRRGGNGGPQLANPNDRHHHYKGGGNGRSGSRRRSGGGDGGKGAAEKTRSSRRGGGRSSDDALAAAKTKTAAAAGAADGADGRAAPRQRSHGVPPKQLALSFHRLCRAGDEPARVKMLIKDGVANLEARDKSGRTPLYWALMGGDAARANLRTLLEARADPAAVDDEGHTLLHHAAQKRDDAALDLLLRHGGWRVANFKENDMWEAPLHFAAMFGAGACCELLLRHKADPGQFTLGGETAADVARQFRFPDVAETLRAGAARSVAAKWKRADAAASFRLRQKDTEEEASREAARQERERREREWRREDKARREAGARARQAAAAAAERERLALREERSAAGAERARRRAAEDQRRKLTNAEEYEVVKEERYLRMLTKERAKRAEETARIHFTWRQADDLMAAQEERRKRDAQAALEGRVADKQDAAKTKVTAVQAFGKAARAGVAAAGGGDPGEKRTAAAIAAAGRVALAAMD